jgi:hypothetical protein
LTFEALETQVFSFGEGKFECEQIAIDPTTTTVKDGDTQITVKPIYNNEEKTCETPFGKARFNVTGCHYLYTGETDENGHAEMHLVCPESAGIMLEAPLGCTITFPEQTVDGVHYSNRINDPENTADDDIRIETTISGFEFTATEICAFGGIPTEGSNGTMTGDITVRGYEDDGSQNDTHGEQVGISVEETGE